MEQSKLISEVIAKFKIAYQYYFKDLTDEEFIGLIGMYQENLSRYREPVLMGSVNSIISKNKFMPSIKEIIDGCKAIILIKQSTIIELMRKDGYFKDPREIEKTYMWLEKGIIPSWLLEDMEKYGYIDNEPKIETKQLNITGGI